MSPCEANPGGHVSVRGLDNTEYPLGIMHLEVAATWSLEDGYLNKT